MRLAGFEPTFYTFLMDLVQYQSVALPLSHSRIGMGPAGADPATADL